MSSKPVVRNSEWLLRWRAMKEATMSTSLRSSLSCARWPDSSRAPNRSRSVDKASSVDKANMALALRRRSMSWARDWAGGPSSSMVCECSRQFQSTSTHALISGSRGSGTSKRSNPITTPVPPAFTMAAEDKALALISRRRPMRLSSKARVSPGMDDTSSALSVWVFTVTSRPFLFLSFPARPPTALPVLLRGSLSPSLSSSSSSSSSPP
mmetsp:Transcript_45560/g.91984  ORF Transcript_45560/g.91984 Transcript_45560/m.91984 type:complete len:210 (+) Transcript_45560:1580-2209(+)